MLALVLRGCFIVSLAAVGSAAVGAPVRIDYADIAPDTVEDFSAFAAIAAIPPPGNEFGGPTDASTPLTPQLVGNGFTGFNGFRLSVGPNISVDTVPAEMEFNRNRATRSGGTRVCGSLSNDDICITGEIGSPVFTFDDFAPGTTEFGIQVSTTLAFFSIGADTEFTVVGESGSAVFVDPRPPRVGTGLNTLFFNRVGFSDPQGLLSVSIVNMSIRDSGGGLNLFYDDVVTAATGSAVGVVPLPGAGLLLGGAVTALLALRRRVQ